jgi:hypothetical protein
MTTQEHPPTNQTSATPTQPAPIKKKRGRPLKTPNEHGTILNFSLSKKERAWCVEGSKRYGVSLSSFLCSIISFMSMHEHMTNKAVVDFCAEYRIRKNQ